MSVFLVRLVVISHVVHYKIGGHLYAYGPYAREIDIWADLFSEVRIAAPLRDGPPPDDTLPFTRSNIQVMPQPETGGTTLWAKLRQVIFLPAMIWSLVWAIRHADVVHVRCPGNLGLLGILLAPLFARYRIAKYAGQWNGYQGEPWTVRLQRTILRSRWWGAPVTVYGSWPGQPAHVIPFFTSIMTTEQVAQAGRVSEHKRISLPLNIVYVGRLEVAKRVSALIEAIAIVKRQGIDVQLTIIGDGSQKTELRQAVDQTGSTDCVSFVGALPFQQVMHWYEWAHCLVLPSVHSEGWPKVIAEGMCHGLVCIAVDHGQVGSMLRGRGIVLNTGSPAEIAGAISAIVGKPEQYLLLGQAAAAWAGQYSLEGLREAIGRLMAEEWGLEFPPRLS